jgi:hypothetical protein
MYLSYPLRLHLHVMARSHLTMAGLRFPTFGDKAPGIVAGKWAANVIEHNLDATTSKIDIPTADRRRWEIQLEMDSGIRSAGSTTSSTGGAAAEAAVRNISDTSNKLSSNWRGSAGRCEHRLKGVRTC